MLTNTYLPWLKSFVCKANKMSASDMISPRPILMKSGGGLGLLYKFTAKLFLFIKYFVWGVLGKQLTITSLFFKISSIDFVKLSKANEYCSIKPSELLLLLLLKPMVFIPKNLPALPMFFPMSPTPKTPKVRPESCIFPQKSPGRHCLSCCSDPASREREECIRAWANTYSII